MSTIPTPSNLMDRLYRRWKEKFLLRIQILAQQAYFVSSLIGITYILINANLTRLQTLHLVFSVFGMVIVVNLLVSLYARFITPAARQYLTAYRKEDPALKECDPDAAWREITTFPWRIAIAQVISACIPGTAVVAYYMNIVTRTTSLQTVHILLGGLISAFGLAIQNAMFLEGSLAPLRAILLPQQTQKEIRSFGIKLQTRLRLMFTNLVAFTILMIGPLGYQKLVNAMAPGVDQAANMRLFLVQLVVISVVVFAISMALASLFAFLLTQPVRDIIGVMDRIERGDLSARTEVITADETAELSIRFNQMLDRLQITQDELENQVETRTRDLTRRTSLLQAATMVARQAVASQDLDTLLNQTANLISERFSYYHTGIFLIDEYGDYAILHAASSEGGRRMLERGHRLAIGRQGIVGNAAYYNRPRIASDVGEDSVYFDNPDLPATRAEAALPLSVHAKVIGVLDIQATEPDAFPSDIVELLQPLADQIALAIQNARLLDESRSALQRLEAITTEGVRRAWSERIHKQKRAYRYTPLGVSPYAATAETASRKTPAPDRRNRIEIPITLRGQTIGKLGFIRKDEDPWPETDRLLANEVATQIGLALENTRLLEETQQRVTQEQSLSELTARLSQSLDPDTIMQTAIRELHQLPNVTEVSVYISPPEVASPDDSDPNA
ncbi:MAG: GAF domain-containing protein [Anaerolineales bacterium]|nr:GAF domain-containing protein [Anaerolineales bacterium]